MEVFSYLVPDYYPEFHCKMGECRSACCQGWPVSIDQKKYFELLGADAPAPLRQKLDCAMYLCDYPSPQRYAQLNHRFDGNCSLRDPDGRCGLQVCLGEEILPDVCRLYPRGIRENGSQRECSCSNSCEAVPELFWDRREPLSFLPLDLPLKPPAALECACGQKGESAEDTRLRRRCIQLLQDRSHSLSCRLRLLYQSLCSQEAPLPQAEERPLASSSLSSLLALTQEIFDHSESLQPWSPLPEAAASHGELSAHYAAGIQAWERLCPQWEAFFEHLLVNYAFFSRFPLDDPALPHAASARTACLLFALLRFLMALVCTKEPGKDACIDLCAALFRLVGHTNFPRYADALLSQRGISPTELALWLQI